MGFSPDDILFIARRTLSSMHEPLRLYAKDAKSRKHQECCSSVARADGLFPLIDTFGFGLK